MPTVNPGRQTVSSDRPVTVFLIGMRLNAPWRVDRWVPVFRSMPRMLQHLAADPDSGLLGYDMWFAPSPLVVQYWESPDKLQAFAAAPDAPHLQTWRDFARLGRDGHIGIWHETYVTGPGTREVVYVDMPSLGLGKALGTVPVGRGMSTARQRLAAAPA